MEEIRILELLEKTDPIENTIVPINSSLTRTNPFEIYTDQEFLLRYSFRKETVRIYYVTVSVKKQFEL
uniref:Uncharacterized protein n=1 Tax=Romanomermis culicivorax TaxID=13658 RepID=A0A915K3R2_ROMCU